MPAALSLLSFPFTEMEKTLFRQPHWYRYISGYSNEKPVIVAENPYGGIVPQSKSMLS